MRRTATALALALAAGGAGCEQPDPEWDTLRIVVDTNAEIPTEIDAFSLVVERSASTLVDERYDASVLQSLPDSFVLGNPEPYNGSPENEIFEVKPITVTVIGYLDHEPRIYRSAELRFNRGKVQLPLPLCAECIDVECPAEQTCKRGTCQGDDIGSTSDLPADGEGAALADALRDCTP